MPPCNKNILEKLSEKNGKIPHNAKDQQNYDHAPERGVPQSSGVWIPGFYILADALTGNYPTGEQKAENYRICFPRPGKIQPKKAQKHSAYAAAGTLQSRHKME